MRRLWLVSLALLLLVSACSGDPTPLVSVTPSPSPSGGADTPALTTKPVVLTVWEEDGAPLEFIRQAAAEFNRKYPNITVKTEAVSPNSSADSFVAGLSGSGSPDLFAARHTDIRELAAGLHVLPAYNQDKTKNLVIDSCAKAITVNGVLYGYPVSAETSALFYNKALISEEELPATWEDMIEYVKSYEGGHGFLMEAGSPYDAIIFTTMGGNRLFGANGDDTERTFLTSGQSIAGMDIFKTLGKTTDIPASELTLSALEDAFASGDCAMCVSGPWSVAAFQNVNYGVAPLPAFEGNDTPSASFADVRVMLTSAYTANPDEASAFAAFLLTDEMQTLRTSLTGTLPSVDIPVNNSYAAGFIAQLQYAFPVPSAAGMERFWGAFGTAAANIWDGGNAMDELTACNAAIIADETEP